MASIFHMSPDSASYKHLSQYRDDDSALLNNLICPRYADADASSAPPSPSSIESFDVLDSVAWRQGYTSPYNHGGKHRLHVAMADRWRRKKSQTVAIMLLLTLLITGCALGGYVAVRHERGKFKYACTNRGGGERCTEIAWAKCIAKNGLGFCEGIL